MAKFGVLADVLSQMNVVRTAGVEPARSSLRDFKSPKHTHKPLLLNGFLR